MNFTIQCVKTMLKHRMNPLQWFQTWEYALKQHCHTFRGPRVMLHFLKRAYSKIFSGSANH